MLWARLQQMLGQVEWGELDVLLRRSARGPGDVQLDPLQPNPSCQARDSWWSTVAPQMWPSIDARLKAIDMASIINTLKTPVLGLIRE